MGFPGENKGGVLNCEVRGYHEVELKQVDALNCAVCLVVRIHSILVHEENHHVSPSSQNIN